MSSHKCHLQLCHLLLCIIAQVWYTGMYSVSRLQVVLPKSCDPHLAFLACRDLWRILGCIQIVLCTSSCKRQPARLSIHWQAHVKSVQFFGACRMQKQWVCGFCSIVQSLVYVCPKQCYSGPVNHLLYCTIYSSDLVQRGPEASSSRGLDQKHVRAWLISLHVFLEMSQHESRHVHCIKYGREQS